MDNNILLYDIQTGDTLDTIGGKIGMTGEQLKDFHNMHCGRMERLWFNNLVGVRQIIIPKEYSNPEQLLEEREKERPSSSITRDFYASTYSVEESFSEVSNSDLKIEYKIDVAFKKKQDNSFPYEIVDVRPYGFTKNGVMPDDKMSSISMASIESISPISFTVGFQGKISGFFEFKNLKQKFDEKRKDLEDFYSGEIYKAYLDKFSANLEKEAYTLQLFSSSLLYQLLFPRMEWFHKTGSWTEQLYFLPNSMLLKCSMQATYNHEGTEIVETQLKGQLRDMFSLQEILRGTSFDDHSEELADGQIELLYTTDKRTKKLMYAEASVTFRKDNEIFRKHTLKLTQNG